MERKRHMKVLVFTWLLLGFFVSSFIDIRTGNSLPGTTILVAPSEVTKAVGETFDIKVNISDVTNLYGLDIQFWWDSTLLKYISKNVRIPKSTYSDGVLWSPFLKYKDVVDAAAGTYWLAASSFGVAKSFNGSGTAFIMTFEVLREGACYLHFTSTGLGDKPASPGEPSEPIPHERVDGKFSTAGAGLAPFASFTFEPAKVFVNKTTVTFNATDSYDLDPSGNVTLYMWNFGDGNKTNTPDPIITHVYTLGGIDYSAALQVKDNNNSLSFPYVKSVLVIDYSDVKIDEVEASPLSVSRGSNVTIDVTVSNIGITSPPTFNVTTYYNKTATEWIKIDTRRVEILTKGTTTTLTFNWTTRVTPDAYYKIKANTTIIENDYDLSNNAAESDTLVYVMPGYPVASFIYAPDIPVPREQVTFDARASSDPDGKITEYRWNFGDGAKENTANPIVTHAYETPGTYNVTLTVVDDDVEQLKGSSTMWVQVSVYYSLDVTIDVGSIHFAGEAAEFYIKTSRLGKLFNATEITAVLYYSYGTKYLDLSENIRIIKTGVYRLPYVLPSDALTGTYTLVVQASYLNLEGTALKSFLVSQTLTGWNPLLLSINGTVATIKTDVGLVQMKLEDINATLIEIIVDSEGEILAKIDSAVGTIMAELSTINATLTDIIVDSEGEILAEIDTALGTVTAQLDTINSRVVAIDGNVITIKTDLGTIKTTTSDVQTSVAGVQTTASTSLYVTSAFSAIAAVVATVVLLLLRKKPK